MKEILDQTLKILRQGGIILYPTDTIWGLGCDATCVDAVARLTELKGRGEEKSMIILLDSSAKLPGYVNEVPEAAYDLIEYAEKPLTIVYDKGRNLAPNVLGPDGSIGIRIVRHIFCEKLLQRFRKPIVSTSANFSGHPSPASFQDIHPKLIEAVDYVVPLGQDASTARSASTIIKLGSSGLYRLIRA